MKSTAWFFATILMALIWASTWNRTERPLAVALGPSPVQRSPQSEAQSEARIEIDPVKKEVLTGRTATKDKPLADLSYAEILSLWRSALDRRYADLVLRNFGNLPFRDRVIQRAKKILSGDWSTEQVVAQAMAKRLDPLFQKGRCFESHVHIPIGTVGIDLTLNLNFNFDQNLDETRLRLPTEMDMQIWGSQWSLVKGTQWTQMSRQTDEEYLIFDLTRVSKISDAISFLAVLVPGPGLAPSEVLYSEPASTDWQTVQSSTWLRAPSNFEVEGAEGPPDGCYIPGR